jgi:beta-lactamase class A
MIKRRAVLQAIFMTTTGTLTGGSPLFAQTSSSWPDKVAANLATIEKEGGGRLGVAMLDTLSGKTASYRGDERFPMCSTFKVLAASALLTRVDAGKETLDRRIQFEMTDVVVNSPVTKTRTGGAGMSLAEICEAAITFSDNTAGNLLLANIGGPAGLTSYARSLGDAVTRLDRIEPDLNEAVPNDPRDTTSPLAMVSNLRTLVTGKALGSSSKGHLIDWLIGNKTGDTRLRAGLPSGWRVGDKTGAGERGTTNDIAVVWPSSDRPPIFMSVYLTGSSPDGEHRNATIAATGRAIANSLA